MQILCGGIPEIFMTGSYHITYIRRKHCLKYEKHPDHFSSGNLIQGFRKNKNEVAPNSHSQKPLPKDTQKMVTINAVTEILDLSVAPETLY